MVLDTETVFLLHFKAEICPKLPSSRDLKRKFYDFKLEPYTVPSYYGKYF